MANLPERTTDEVAHIILWYMIHDSYNLWRVRSSRSRVNRVNVATESSRKSRVSISFDYSKRKKKKQRKRKRKFDESNVYEATLSREREIYQIVYRIKMWLCMCVYVCVCVRALPTRETRRLSVRVRKGECGVWLCTHTYILLLKYIILLYHVRRGNARGQKRVKSRIR